MNLRGWYQLALRELAERFSNHRLRLVAAIALIVIPLAVSINARHYLDRQVHYQADAEQREIDRQNGQRVVTGGQVEPALRVLRAPRPETVLVGGQEPYFPASWQMSPEGPQQGGMGDDVAVPQPSPGFDLDFIIRVVLGLLAVILGVEALAKDRSAGTLRTLVTQPIASWTLVAAKMLAGAITVGAVLIAAMAIAVGSAAAVAPGIVDRSFILTAAMILVSGWLYLVMLFAVGVLCAEVIRSHHTALVTGVIIWLISALVAIPLTVLTARGSAATREAESSKTKLYQSAIRDIQGQLGTELRRNLGPTALRDFTYDGSVRAGVDAVWGREIHALRAKLDAIDAAFDRDRSRGRTIEDWAALVNPASHFSSAAAEFSGAGNQAADRWQHAVREYAGVLQSRLFDEARPKLTLRVPDTEDGPPARLLSIDRRPAMRVAELPDFTPPAASVQERISAGAPPLLLLTLQCLIVVFVAAWLFVRRVESW